MLPIEAYLKKKKIYKYCLYFLMLREAKINQTQTNKKQTNKDTEISLPLAFLLSKRKWVFVLIPNALWKTVLYQINTQALSVLCSLQQQVTLRVLYNTCLRAHLCFHSL